LQVRSLDRLSSTQCEEITTQARRIRSSG
jgi:hypothetical protein